MGGRGGGRRGSSSDLLASRGRANAHHWHAIKLGMKLWPVNPLGSEKALFLLFLLEILQINLGRVLLRSTIYRKWLGKYPIETHYKPHQSKRVGI